MAEHKTFQGRLVQKHDTKANWDKATNFIPLKGEIIIYDDLNQMKIGDGGTVVSDLPFIIPTVPTKLSELVDDKILWVKFSGLSGSNITLDKTFNEINNAINNNQLVIGHYKSYIIQCEGFQQQFIVFRCDIGSIIYYYRLAPSGVVMFSSTKLQQNYLDTTIDETSSVNSSHYPSVKAVIDYVEANKSTTTITTWTDDGT